MNEVDTLIQEQIEGLRQEGFAQCFEHWFETMNKCISVQGHHFQQTNITQLFQPERTGLQI